MRNTFSIILDIMKASKDPELSSRDLKIKNLCGELLVKETNTNELVSCNATTSDNNCINDCISTK